MISKKLTEVTNQVDLGTFGKRYRTFHVNCMRKWTSPTPAAFMALDEEDLNHERENTHIMQTSHHMESEKLKIRTSYRMCLDEQLWYITRYQPKMHHLSFTTL